MQIISIDVGMKNLAFCLVEIKNNDYIIKDWDIIDLCETQNHICKFPKKNNIQCSKKAKYVKDGIYYCKIHGKKSEYKIPTNELKASKLKKSRLSELKIIVDKYDISCCKIKQTKAEYIRDILYDFSNNYLKNVNKINASDISLTEYGIKISKLFKKRFKNKKIDKVLVENQIGTIALRMKTLQGMIIQHFIENDITDIECVNSSNKLKLFLEKKKTSYNERKKLGIKHTLELLEKHDTNKNRILYFNRHKKKDDLADSFLQCFWYINEKKIIKL